MDLSVSDVMKNARVQFAALVTQALSELLSRKHLYQFVRIDAARADEIVVAAKKRIPREMSEGIGVSLANEQLDDWRISSYVAVDQLSAALSARKPSEKGIEFPVPNGRLYCRKCRREEPFHPKSASDVRATSSFSKRPDLGYQAFAFTMECQSCLSGTGELFLVQREGPKLTLVGRSPIEHVVVPREIPDGKPAEYFSKAIVAFNSGYTLAGDLYLRVLIERHAVATCADLEGSPSADEYVNAYMDRLDADLKKWSPSLREVYGKLSAALHLADEREAVFEKAREDIEKHFRALRSFREDRRREE